MTSPSATPGRAPAVVLRALAFAGVGALAWLAIGAGLGIAKGRYGDFSHFYWAAEAMRQGRDIYTSGENGYIYPPLLAFVLIPLSCLPLPAAATAWLGVNLLTLVLGAGVAARRALADFSLPSGRTEVAAVASLAVILALDKARSVCDQGQTDFLILLGFALGYAWRDRRPMAAGLALGLAANVKYLSLLALPYLLVRRRWRAAFWTGVFTFAFALLPALATGWHGNLLDLDSALDGLWRAGGWHGAGAEDANISDVQWDRSISITSSLARAVGDGRGLLAAGGVAAMCAVAALAIYRARGISPITGAPAGGRAEHGGPAPAVSILEWSGLIVACLVFSPQTEGRHLVLLVFVNAVSAALILFPRPGIPRWALLAGAIVLQLGINLPPGGRQFREAVEDWRAVAGASWCVLAMYFLLLWAGTGLFRGRATPTRAAPPG